VKGAEAAELAPGALERHMARDDIAKPDTGTDLVEEIRRYRHSSSRHPFPAANAPPRTPISGR
jgi:hypothetical protein